MIYSKSQFHVAFKKFQESTHTFINFFLHNFSGHTGIVQHQKTILGNSCGNDTNLPPFLMLDFGQISTKIIHFCNITLIQ